MALAAISPASARPRTRPAARRWISSMTLAEPEDAPERWGAAGSQPRPPVGSWPCACPLRLPLARPVTGDDPDDDVSRSCWRGWRCRQAAFPPHHQDSVVAPADDRASAGDGRRLIGRDGAAPPRKASPPPPSTILVGRAGP